ncbi:class I SAM-dependent methyltransferase, partial [Desulfobacter sp. UBA2225]|uniref:class I SAM-dependent methyltransferase n=1 Tax=Desulfobacter sp. UBA2225 TaxID=1961413 RepID=UPI00257B8421
AAKGGAASALSVDRAETAITWVKENLALNQLSASCHTQVQMDTFDFLKKALRLEHRYDLAVVDPPSYSTTRLDNMHFDIAKDYPFLLNQVFKLMRLGSTVFFSTNHQNFLLDENKLDAADIKEITQETIPEDYVSKKKQIHRCWRITC